MSGPDDSRGFRLTSGMAARAALFFAFWLSISGWKAADLPVGLAAAAGATWASLALLPEQGAAVPLGEVRSKGAARRLAAWAAFFFAFVKGSALSGFDVARRALRRDLDMRPGYVTAPLHLPSGSARNAFCAIASLMPGTLPVGTDKDTLVLHGLDVGQPIAEDLAREEDRFIRAFGDE
jgi:multicomponent Na+:H+ antiporter subunit E